MKKELPQQERLSNKEEQREANINSKKLKNLQDVKIFQEKAPEQTKVKLGKHLAERRSTNSIEKQARAQKRVKFDESQIKIENTEMKEEPMEVVKTEDTGNKKRDNKRQVKSSKSKGRSTLEGGEHSNFLDAVERHAEVLLSGSRDCEDIRLIIEWYISVSSF